MAVENQRFDVPQEWLNNDSKNTKRHMTNSIHHQGVYDREFSDFYPHTLSPEFDTLAVNSVYGNVEVMIHKDLPIAAEQAHPEERWDPTYTIMILNYLLTNLEN